MALTNLSLYDQAESRQESLIIEHMPMVKRVAVHLKVRVPPFMELDELIQVGMVGLIEAARAFDPTMGNEFENFALSRVRGAMLDEVRRQSYLPRSAVAFNKTENEAIHALAATLGRKPTQMETAEYLGLEIEQFHRERAQAKRFETYSMEIVGEEVLGIPADVTFQPEVAVEEAEFMGVVTAAIEQLPDRDKLIVSLYYVDELNLKEIGEVIGVSESRVSQILSQIVKKLRSDLRMG